MLEIIRDACVRLLTQYDDFWLLAALTSASYEEGTHPDFSRSVRSYEAAGVPKGVIAQLYAGINGNLRLILDHVLLEPRGLAGGERPDLTLRGDAGSHAYVEVKLLYDCALAKQYGRGRGTVPNDREKIRRMLHDEMPGAQGFQVVFFTQLPHFQKPAGLWADRMVRVKSRRSWMVEPLIEGQFLRLCDCLPPPTWPDDRPRMHALRLHLVDESTLRERYRMSFKPSPPHSDWGFDAAEHLRDAQVGVAVWQVPRADDRSSGR